MSRGYFAAALLLPVEADSLFAEPVAFDSLVVPSLFFESVVLDSLLSLEPSPFELVVADFLGEPLLLSVT